MPRKEGVSLSAQGDGRVDARRAACWNVAGQERSAAHEQNHRAIGCQVIRADPIEEIAEQARRTERTKQPQDETQ